MRVLMSYEWKGNIREMQNVIERAVIFAEEDVIKISDIGLIGLKAIALGEDSEDLQNVVKAYEKEHIRRVLAKYDWDKVEAATALNVGLSSLYRKIDELEINIDKRRRKERAG